MDLFLDPTAARSATRSLFEQVREAIVSGRLAGLPAPPEEKVPDGA